MKSNKQWLNELAATDPQALRAWFDAPRADCGQVDATDVDNGTDSREQLECDIDWCLGSLVSTSVNVQRLKSEIIKWLDRQEAITSAAWNSLKNSWVTAHDSLLIENGELREQVDNLSDERDRLNRRNSELRVQYDKLKRENDKLSHDLAESERFREELREELSIAYDHAHDLLARRDRRLA